MHLHIECSGSMMITFLRNRCLCGTCYTAPLQLGGRPELPFNNHSDLVLYVCVEGSVGVSVPVLVLDLLVGHFVEVHLLVGHLVCHQEYRYCFLVVEVSEIEEGCLGCQSPQIVCRDDNTPL